MRSSSPVYAAIIYICCTWLDGQITINGNFPSGHRATCNKNGQVGYPWKVEPWGSPKLPVGTYFVPRRQHTVEVLTQNWLYCTFQRSPAISICWSPEKKISSNIKFRFADPLKRFCPKKYDIMICVLSPWRARNNAGLVFKENLILAAIPQMAEEP